MFGYLDSWISQFFMYPDTWIHGYLDIMDTWILGYFNFFSIRIMDSQKSLDIQVSGNSSLHRKWGPHRFVPTWFENVPPDLVTALHLFTYHACFLISLFQSSAATLAKHNGAKAFTNSHLNFLRLQLHKIFYCAIWRKNISWNLALFEHKNVTSWIAELIHVKA